MFLKRRQQPSNTVPPFFLTGSLSTVAGVLGLVPYAPYASSLGFLQSTGIRERAPFFVGSLFFVFLGMVPALSAFFSTIPQSVGNTVLFVAYLQLFRSALRNIEGLTFEPKTVYRIALPALVGLAIMSLPATAFATLPATLTTTAIKWHARWDFTSPTHGVGVLS